MCVCIHISTLLGVHVCFSWNNTFYLPNVTVEHSSAIHLFVCVYIFLLCSALTCTFHRESALYLLYFNVDERWGAGVETQKNVRGEIGGWGRVPFNETYAPLLSTIYDGA